MGPVAMPPSNVHGVKAYLHLERFWSQNIAFTTRLVDAGAAETVQSNKLDPKRLITHGFKLDRILDAYDTFLELRTHERSRSSSRPSLTVS
jgi:threonine dehydrogenase-like Zn-dependent dehydrogenase